LPQQFAPQALQAGDVYRLQVMLNLQPQALLERAGEGDDWYDLDDLNDPLAYIYIIRY
jgi:hypothetical protein